MLPAKISIDGAKIEAALGVKGQSKDGMFKATIGRAATTASCGCAVGKTMGVNTWAAFASSDAVAVVISSASRGCASPRYFGVRCASTTPGSAFTLTSSVTGAVPSFFHMKE